MDTKRLDLNLLVTLEALLVEQNVTKTAARLHLSQPAVSAQLSRLRDVFDDALLIPVQRGMVPTAKGAELLEPLRLALDQVRAAVAEHASFDPSSASLVISIACTDYTQVAIVKPLLKALRKLAPGIRVALHNLDVAELEARMARGDIDLAFMTPQTAPAGLRARHLFDERYVLIGRRRHPRLRGPISVDEFMALEHVVVSPRGGGFVTPADDALATLGHRRNVVLSSASFLFVPEMVSQSDFVALVPERLVAGGSHKLTILDCPFPVPGFGMSMVWHERGHGHGAQRWVRDTVLSLMGHGQQISPAHHG